MSRVARNPAPITPEYDGDFRTKHFAGTRKVFGDGEAEFGLHSLRQAGFVEDLETEWKSLHICLGLIWKNFPYCAQCDVTDLLAIPGIRYTLHTYTRNTWSIN